MLEKTSAAAGPADDVGTGWWAQICAGHAPTRADWMLIALTTLLAGLGRGYHYGALDQAVLLPFTRYFRDPSLYRGDLLVDSIRTMQPIFWQALGLLGRVVALPWLFAGLHVIASVLSAIAVWLLAVNLFRDRWSANLSLALVALSVPQEYFLGLDPLRLVWPELTQRSFAFPFIVLALVCVIRRRTLLAGVLSGLMLNVHPISGAAGAGMALGGALFDAQQRRRVPAAVAVGVVCALPVIINFATATGVSTAGPAQVSQWLEITRLRLGHHFYPLTWEFTRWAGIALLLLLGVRSILALRGTWSPPHTIACVFLAFAVVIWVPAFIFTEVIPSPLVIQMQLFRSSKFAALLALLLFAHHQRLRLGSGGWRSVRGMLALAVPVVMWVSLTGAALLALAHVTGDGLLQRRSRLPVLLGLALVICALTAATALSVRDRARAEYTHWWGGADPRWVQTQLWVRENTARDATVLVAPNLAGFRAFSERAIVGSWKDGGIHQNDPATLIEWWRRMHALGLKNEPDTNSLHGNLAFAAFDERRLTELGRRYGARYLVTKTDHDLAWRPLFANSRYAVYELPP